MEPCLLNYSHWGGYFSPPPHACMQGREPLLAPWKTELWEEVLRACIHPSSAELSLSWWVVLGKGAEEVCLSSSPWGLVLSPRHLRRALSFLPLRQGLQFSLSRETSQECDWRTSQVAPHSVSNNTDILISNSNVLCLNLFQSEKGSKRAGVL